MIAASEKDLTLFKKTCDDADRLCIESNSGRSRHSLHRVWFQILRMRIAGMYYLRRDLTDNILSQAAKKDMQTKQVALVDDASQLGDRMVRHAPSLSPDVDKMIEEAKEMCKDIEGISLEEKKMIFSVMGGDVGTGVGSFGGHWYQCPNGHVYTIGECGGAMQQTTCPECGQSVGGGDHRLDQSNSVANDFLREVGARQNLRS
eukprot:TRINITY_DN9407_c0_g2_i1.p1 TRINITY_DN9407_c0_g2~~TRINITY_DN9407_c0_g2_i1.p1  ORF type:complete len:203 (-),score=34.37 TRINITY_DN9407_c0_g2_i1:47-655(-)